MIRSPIHFCNILLVAQVSLIQCERGLYKDMNTRTQKSLGAILEATYHNALLRKGNQQKMLL